MRKNKDRLDQLLQLPSVTQIGMVVPDLEEALVSFQEKFNVESFEWITDFSKLGYMEIYYLGKPGKFNSLLAFFRLGIMEMEIIQPVSGQSIYRDFLDQGRQGIHHLGFDVGEDFDERLAAYARIGIKVLMSGRGSNRAFAYLDTEKAGGVIYELLKRGGPRRPVK